MLGDDRPDKLTGPWLRELLDRNRVVRGQGLAHRPPSIRECHWLAESLNSLGFMAKAELWRRSLRQALDMLEESLPRERDYWVARLREWSGVMRLGAVARIQALDTLAGGIEAVRRLKDYDATPPVEQWHDFAPDLARMFREAMERANPGLRLGLSDKGPVAQYVAAVIPYITGDRPTSNAVARHLQRQKAKFQPAVHNENPQQNTPRVVVD